MAAAKADDGRVEVRVTMFDQPIRVRPRAIRDLRSQGILVESSATEAAAPKNSGGRKPAGSGTPES